MRAWTAFVGRSEVFGCIILAVVLGSSFAAAASTRVWTTQADFRTGTLANADSASAPGDLLLATNASSFAKSVRDPVLTPAGGTAWDADSINGVAVLFNGTGFKMWYAGCTGSAPYFTCSIGYATSPDGIAWNRYAGNPVITPTPSEGTVELPTVIYDGGVYKMWFESYGSPGLVINYATSADGVSWTQFVGNPVWAGGAPWDSQSVANPLVVRIGSQLEMYYSARGTNYDYEIGRVLSTNGINWTEDPANPLLAQSESWETGLGVFPAGIIHSSSNLTMYYSTGAATGGGYGRAFSSDGVAWTRDSANPILQGSATGWDSYQVGAAKFVPVGNQTYGWYAGKGPSSNGWSYGLATTPGYSPVGSFLSPVVDSGARGTTWTTLNWSANAPPNTQVVAAFRDGDTAVPDTTWSGWYIAAFNLTLPGAPRARFAQVQAVLSTSTGTATPILHDIELSYLLDRTSPPTLLTVGSSNWTSSSQPNLSWRFTDPDPSDVQAGYEVQVAPAPDFTLVTFDSGVVSSTSTTAAPGIALQDGIWYWRVRTEDSWGSWSNYSLPFAFHIDSTPPAVTAGFGSPALTAGSTTFITSGTLVYLNASDGPGIGGALVLYTVDSNIPAAYTVPFHVMGTDGQHFVRFTAADLLGNTLAVQTLVVTLDNTPPISTLAVTPSGSDFSVTEDATDAGSGVAKVFLSVDNGPWTLYTGAITLSDAGKHTVRGYAVDKLGNVGATQSISVVIPNLQPYLAGSIGALGLLLGLILFRVRKGGPWIPSTLSFAFGAVEVALAITSAGTGALAIPPWPGVPIVLDALLGGGIVLALVLGWRWKRHAAPGPPQGPSPPLSL